MLFSINIFEDPKLAELQIRLLAQTRVIILILDNILPRTQALLLTEVV